jgi:hypothetical protein
MLQFLNFKTIKNTGVSLTQNIEARMPRCWVCGFACFKTCQMADINHG